MWRARTLAVAENGAMDLQRVREVEAMASRAWPALEVLDLDGWRLRWAAGFSRRANSVWPQAVANPGDLASRLDLIEALYAQRGVRARYQVSVASRPPDLALRLAERGYRREVDTSVETASLTRFQAAITRRVRPNAITVSGAECPDSCWWDVWTEAEGATPAERATAEAILERVPAPSLYAVAKQHGRPVAVGRAVLDGAWLGLFSMATVEGARRQGAARAVMRWLAMWGEAAGVPRVYLQVEVPNKPARRLYAGAGFRPLYRYTYWSAPDRAMARTRSA